METVQQPLIGLDEKFIPLMRRFGDVFSGERIWIGELLQNARRACATRISILTDQSDPHYFRIEDNGHGIEKFQALLDPGSSDWDPKVMERDLPFGVGFWSAIEIARRVEVRSRGWRAVIQKERLLDGEAIPLQPDDFKEGTSITVHLTKTLSQVTHRVTESFRDFLGDLVSGFPIPVFLNGQPLSRPHAIDVWKGLQFHFSDGIAQVILNRQTTRPLDLTYYQGLPLGSYGSREGQWPSLHAAGMVVYLHLIGNTWRLKAPDRIYLYDSEEVDRKVRSLHAAVKRAVAEHVVSIGQGEEFFDELIEWGCKDLVRNLPIPAERWRVISQPLHLPQFESDDQGHAVAIVPPDDRPLKEDSRRFLIGGNFCFWPCEEDIRQHFAAYLFSLPILASWNDPDHWVQSAEGAEELEAFFLRKLTVSVKPKEVVAEGEWRGKRVVICKRYHLHLAGYGKKEVREDAFLQDTFWIIDGPYRENYPIDQAFSYQNEDDDFDASMYEEDHLEFRSLLAVLKNDRAILVSWALERYRTSLQGLTFMVKGLQEGIIVEEWKG